MSGAAAGFGGSAGGIAASSSQGYLQPARSVGSDTAMWALVEISLSFFWPSGALSRNLRFLSRPQWGAHGRQPSVDNTTKAMRQKPALGTNNPARMLFSKPKTGFGALVCVFSRKDLFEHVWTLLAPANQHLRKCYFPVPKTGFGGAWLEKTRLDTFGPLACKPTRNLPKCYFPAQNRFWEGACSHGLPKYYFPVPKTGFGGALVCILTEKTNLRHLQTRNLPKCYFPAPKQVLVAPSRKRHI